MDFTESVLHSAKLREKLLKLLENVIAAQFNAGDGNETM